MNDPEMTAPDSAPTQRPVRPDTPPRLYLVPAPLSQTQPGVDLLARDLHVVQHLKHWLVETPKTARAWLKLYGHPTPLAELEIVSMADFEHEGELENWLKNKSSDVGVISDAGCPGVADPGAAAVAAAHRQGWVVCPLVGPSSILLALMGSGLSGQSFVFHGYLPVEGSARQKMIAETARTSAQLRQTQIAIETPYRNAALFEALCAGLPGTARLCIASELTGPQQSITTRDMEQWRKNPPELGKQASLFLWQTSSVSESSKTPPRTAPASRRR